MSRLNAMTVDVEDYFHVSALAEVISRKDWERMEFRAENSTDRLLDDVRGEGHQGDVLRARLGDAAQPRAHPPHPRGGSRGGLSWPNARARVPPDAGSLSARRRALRRPCSKTRSARRCIGYRAASYSITAQSLWALDILCELGFQYDSSIFPIAHDRYGIPGASTKPGPIVAPKGGRIVEFPLSTKGRARQTRAGRRRRLFPPACRTGSRAGRCRA